MARHTCWVSLFREIVSREVEEDGGGKADGVDAVEDAAVAGDGGAEIFDAAVAFDGGHDESTGESHPLYGRDFQTIVNLIRGEAGTQMTLRVLRENGATGKMEEHFIPVTRSQLYLDEKLIPKPPPG